MQTASLSPLCGSERNIDGEQIACNRRIGHPITQKHRAIMADGTTILWDGGYSAQLPGRCPDTCDQEHE